MPRHRRYSRLSRRAPSFPNGRYSTARRSRLRKSLADAQQEPVADLAIGLQFLLPTAFGSGRVRRRPIFHVCGKRARQIQSLVVGFGRKRDDKVEVKALPIVELL